MGAESLFTTRQSGGFSLSRLEPRDGEHTMITRQKVLVSILREADGKASRMQVTTWAVIPRHETDSRTLAASARDAASSVNKC